ncbi:MAG: serine hydrolase [Acidobacteria bacterium]|nr:serine hydrolase [Acidobacteriota bacterium]
MRTLLILAWILSLPSPAAAEKKPASGRTARLEARIRQAIRRAPGTVSFFAKNLDTGQSYGVRADERVRTASTIKLPILAAVFGEVEAGRATWTEELTVRKDDMVSGSGVVRELSGGIKLPLKDLAHLMIVVSDNTATNVILDRIPGDTVNRWMDQIGLPETRVLRKILGDGNNLQPAPGGLSQAGRIEENKRFGIGVSTPREMVTLLEKLEGGQIIEPAACREMIGILKRQQYKEFWHQLLERVNGLPAVESATLLGGLPPIRPLDANDTQIEGFVPQPGGPIQNIDYYQMAGDRFLETTGARLIEGRLFDRRDGESAPPVVVVNQTMARTFWPGQSPLGKRLRPGFQGPWRTVIGVVGDIKNAGIEKPASMELFFPIRQAQGGNRNGLLFLKIRSGSGSVISSIRREIASIDPSLPIAQVRSFEEVLGVAQARPRFLTMLLSLFSGVALALAAVGIYGVLSYLVAQRTSEFGIRMAIGAGQSDVLWMVLRQGMVLGLAGVVAGAAGAALLTRFLRSFLYAVDALDPATFAGMAAVLTAVVLAACLLPARRATRVDPMTALRYE